MGVLLADLSNSAHQAAVIELLDMYSRSEFGDGKPLSALARTNLISGLVKHGGARVFLAYEENQPAGVAICFLGFSTFKGKPLLNIHDLAVAPQFRGRGIGRALLEAAAATAREHGCCKVTLEVRADNEVAKNLYRRLGFQSSDHAETWFWARPLE